MIDLLFSYPVIVDPLTPLEILYVARLYFLETAMARTPSSTGLLERWMSAQYSSSSRRFVPTFLTRPQNKLNAAAHFLPGNMITKAPFGEECPTRCSSNC